MFANDWKQRPLLKHFKMAQEIIGHNIFLVEKLYESRDESLNPVIRNIEKLPNVL